MATITPNKTHSLDTNGWLEFPFEYDNRQFISKISQTSPLFDRIIALSPEVFQELNRSAMRDLLGSGLDTSQVLDRLTILNQDASHAVIELA